MLKKRTLLWLLAVGLLLVIAACGSANEANESSLEAGGEEATQGGEGETEEVGNGEQMILRYGELNPDDHPITEGAYEFSRLVEEATDGRIKIEIFPASSLGTEREQLQSIQAGALDFFRPNSSALTDFGAAPMNVLGLPFIFENREHQWNVLNGPVGEEILQSTEEFINGMKGLTYYDDGARHIFTQGNPVESVEDMSRLKIRVPENAIFMDMISAFDADPTPINYAELYSALQTGIVDGAENTIAGYLTNSFYEVAENLSLTSHVATPGVVVVSEMTWNKLSAEDQAIIQEAAQQSSEFVRTETEKFEEEALTELEELGANIIHFDDLSNWQAEVSELYDTYGGDYADLIETIRATE